MEDIRLSIELVPSTSWYDNVRNALTKEEWDIVRKKAYRQDNYKCHICGSTGILQRSATWPVEAHEVWEYNDKTHVQKLVKIVSLCPICHHVKHMGLASINGQMEEVIKQLCNVNKWSREVSKSYIAFSFDLWKERSEHNWTVDISNLDKYIRRENK